ncbi:MAG: anthranilate synthase component I family protein [Gemmatimonadaceae bacterium]|nr:anthranilate synthase component I family protein [Gemmatimonadaceae bacterium]NUR18568.1 anthranilate synthase component I family protein [Gemmatimonadaceae bacterium]NUS98654.1 anthranilate synthase component I family protein [Gemmatimonadaceae bacterium]
MSFETFRERAANGGIVPVWRDCLLDSDTPVTAFAKLRRGPFAFLLESAPAGGETWSRYTFLGTEPRGAWRLNAGVVHDWSPERGWHNERTPADPLADLRSLVDAHQPADVPELGAFWSGAVGYFSYDVVRLIEELPDTRTGGPRVPDALFVFTRAVVIIDNLRSQARVVVGVPVQPGTGDTELRAAYDDASRTIDETIERLRAPREIPPLDLDRDARPATGRSTYDRLKFMADVERIREYIFAGDAFQVLLARRIVVPHDFPSDALYRALRALNPSPYMYHLVLDGVELVGSSPELLVRVAGSRVTVRPIAGTRPRGRTPGEDDALAAELLADDKERAEHIMLVDLGRNDVGRIARYGSVEVTDLMTVERYSHVLHIVSEVRGTLPADASALDVFRAVFPAGTMTGAPKVRAMQIIDELEPEPRRAYAGAVGYIAAGDRRMDLAITIRTCVIADGEASVQTGAGIVADSVAEREWDETENKARAMLTAIGQVRRALGIASQ